MIVIGHAVLPEKRKDVDCAQKFHLVLQLLMKGNRQFYLEVK